MFTYENFRCNYCDNTFNLNFNNIVTQILFVAQKHFYKITCKLNALETLTNKLKY